MFATKTAEEPRRFRWTRGEYYRMAEMGLFDGRRVELIGGEIFEMSPQQSDHAEAVTLAQETMMQVFGQGYRVRVQLPLSLGLESDPEPDVAVVAGVPHGFRHAHPTTALLIVEVAESTLSFDRTEKASLYASAGITDYWIVNLVDRQLEVRRNPIPAPAQLYGWEYAQITILTAADSVSPLAAPQASVAVANLLP